MLTLPEVLALINRRKNRVLLYAETALSEAQFRAYRRLLLDEFGREGLEADLERLAAERSKGTDRAGQYVQGKEVRHE